LKKFLWDVLGIPCHHKRYTLSDRFPPYNTNNNYIIAATFNIFLFAIAKTVFTQISGG